MKVPWSWLPGAPEEQFAIGGAPGRVMLHKLKVGSANNLANIGVTHSGENKNPAKGPHQVSVLGPTRANGTHLFWNGGVEHRQVASHTTLNELFKDNVGSSDSHLRSPAAGVIDLDCERGARHCGGSRFDSCQRMPGHVWLRNLLLYDLNHLILDRFWFNRTPRDHYSKSYKPGSQSSRRKFHGESFCSRPATPKL